MFLFCCDFPFIDEYIYTYIRNKKSINFIIISLDFQKFAISQNSCLSIFSLFSGTGLWSTLRILMIVSSSLIPPTSLLSISEAQYASFCAPLFIFFSSLASSLPKSSSHSLFDCFQLFHTLKSNDSQMLIFTILLYYSNSGRPAIFFPTLIFAADF